MTDIQQIKQKAWLAGENDTVVEDILLENAQLFIDSEVKETLTDEQQTEVIDAYRDGFLGRDLKLN